jgi:acetyl esterase/lipase
VGGMGWRSVAEQYALPDTCGVLRQPEARDEARGRASRVLPAVAAALAAAVLLLGFAPPAQAAPVVRTFSYGTAKSQVLDAYYDRTTTGSPWVVVIHGGSWTAGDKSTMLTAVKAFQAAGFKVFNMNYRLATEAPWPAQRLDGANAILYIKTHWRTFGINPNRGGVYGFSAGGHIASTLGTVGAGKTRTRAVISVAGVNDPYRGWTYVHDEAVATAAGVTTTTAMKYVSARAEYLVRCTPDRTKTDACWKRWLDINPATYATPDDAAFLLVHGDADTWVPYSESRALHHHLRRAAVPSKFVAVAGADHGQATVWADPARKKQAIDFLRAATR